ncbi:hypothetical protein HUT06_17420 [Actinomadura sp. NAK00032]|uniref:hypothetical protein n=1 Tax=Actinomadura sp. NAK00032 TaxID=2742128 RepID=UPI0015920E6D|nr:hypothetical protein [Actinomadura sp. NAK00032]QKW35598.1 hypothetical protein HUT06_17420 [Actinomadura sp. NAK00032]
MMMKPRSAVGAALVGGVVATGVLSAVSAAPAAAASACGSGYNLLHSYHITPNSNGSGTAYGYLDVYYSPTTRKNCAIARSGGFTYGKLQGAWVLIGKWRGGGEDDDGWGSTYKYYAGPVYTYAPNECIWAQGMVRYNNTYYKRSTGAIACN